MGFSYKSNGLLISPGDKLSLPIASEEAAVLDLQWNSTDDNELEFSLTFMPSDGGEESMLMQSKKHSKLEGKFDIAGPGSCVLHWTNINSGWFGSACTVAYTATLQSTKEALEKQKRELEAEIERAQVEAERLAAERREKAEEEARLRREDRDEQISKLRAASEPSEVCLAATLRSIERSNVEISRLQEELTVAQEARAGELAMAGVLEQELSASREAIEALTAEQDEDDFAIMAAKSTECGKDQAEEEEDEEEECKEEKKKD